MSDIFCLTHIGGAIIEQGRRSMGYIQSVLQPDERLKYVTDIHWIIFLPGIGLFILAVLFYLLALNTTSVFAFWAGIASFMLILAAIALLSAWFTRVTTEIAVTDRRIIYKRGFIGRRTIEMEMDKVESVDVDQSVMGRILNYGDIIIRGVGVGIEPLKNIGSPIEFRNHMIAERSGRGQK
jgi:uncharacterized membrane protein YdbT with pleckstrin-like domain